jgi:hypothetical protein
MVCLCLFVHSRFIRCSFRLIFIHSFPRYIHLFVPALSVGFQDLLRLVLDIEARLDRIDASAVCLVWSIRMFARFEIGFVTLLSSNDH